MIKVRRCPAQITTLASAMCHRANMHTDVVTMVLDMLPRRRWRLCASGMEPLLWC